MSGLVLSQRGRKSIRRNDIKYRHRFYKTTLESKNIKQEEEWKTTEDEVIKRIKTYYPKKIANESLKHDDLYGTAICKDSIIEEYKALKHHTSLLYGEILAQGITKMMKRFQMNKIRTVYDFGSGLGKSTIQLFEQFPSIQKCVGIEFSINRFMVAYKAVIKMAQNNPSRYEITSKTNRPCPFICLTEKTSNRTLMFYNASVFDINVSDGDLIVCNVNFNIDDIDHKDHKDEKDEKDKNDEYVIDALKKLFYSLKSNSLFVSYKDFSRSDRLIKFGYAQAGKNSDEFPFYICADLCLPTTWTKSFNFTLLCKK